MEEGRRMATTGYNYWKCRTGRPDSKYEPDRKFRPERMKDDVLRNRLCAAGPDYCPKCKSCGYGLEWLKRHPEGGGEK